MFIDAKRQSPPKNGWYKTRTYYYDGTFSADKYRLFKDGEWFFYSLYTFKVMKSNFARRMYWTPYWEFNSNPKQKFKEIKNEA